MVHISSLLTWNHIRGFWAWELFHIFISSVSLVKPNTILTFSLLLFQWQTTLVVGAIAGSPGVVGDGKLRLSNIYADHMVFQVLTMSFTWLVFVGVKCKPFKSTSKNQSIYSASTAQPIGVGLGDAWQQNNCCCYGCTLIPWVLCGQCLLVSMETFKKHFK